MSQQNIIRQSILLVIAVSMLTACGRAVAPSQDKGTVPLTYEEQTKIWKQSNEATRHLANFDADSALKELDSVSGIAQQNPQLIKMRAAALAQKGKFFESSEQITRLIEHGYGNKEDLMVMRAQYYLDAKLNDKAIDDCDRVLNELESREQARKSAAKNAEPDPNMKRIENIEREFLHDIRGSAFYRKTLYEKAERDFSRILESNPDSERFLLARAEVREKLKNSGGADSDRNKARKLFEATIRTAKSEFARSEKLADEVKKAQNHKVAEQNQTTVAQSQKAVAPNQSTGKETHSDAPPLKAALEGTVGPKFYLATVSDLESDIIADVYQRLGEHEKAKQTLMTLIKSQSPWAKSTESHLYTRLGWLHIMNGDMKGAQDNFKQAMALRGGFPVPKEQQ